MKRGERVSVRLLLRKLIAVNVCTSASNVLRRRIEIPDVKRTDKMTIVGVVFACCLTVLLFISYHFSMLLSAYLLFFLVIFYK